MTVQMILNPVFALHGNLYYDSSNFSDLLSAESFLDSICGMVGYFCRSWRCPEGAHAIRSNVCVCGERHRNFSVNVVNKDDLTFVWLMRYG